MNSSPRIVLPKAVRDVRQLSGAPSLPWEEFLAQREMAARNSGAREISARCQAEAAAQQALAAELGNGILRSLQNAVPQVVRDTETAFLHLALEVAQKVVGALPITVEMIERVAREALAEAEDKSEVAVLLNPEDLALLRQHHSEVLNGSPEFGSVKFVESPGMKRGDCMVQTRFGEIDGRREVKFNQLHETISS